MDHQNGQKDSKPRLLKLVNTLQSQIQSIQKHLTETNQPEPSFVGTEDPTDYDGIDDTRYAALESILELQELLTTPRETLVAEKPSNLISRHIIVRYGIAQLVPVTSGGEGEGEPCRTYESLAEATGIPVKLLRRTVRHAMTHRIFYEPKPGYVAHTKASRVLAEDAKMRDYLGTMTDEVWQATVRLGDAMERWPNARGWEQTAYWLAHGRTLQEHLESSPEMMARYNNAMGAMANDRSFSIEHVVKGYDWGALGKATVVDVGGGVGTVSHELVKAFPQLDCIVQDRQEVVEQAIAAADQTERIRFMAHDIFETQPVKDAAVYLIRRVLMEKTDKECVEFLKASVPALKAGAVVLIQDPMVPDPGSCPMWQERKFRESDVAAFALVNFYPREQDEWQEIFKQAGSGYEYRGVTMAPNSNTAFVEAVWRG